MLYLRKQLNLVYDLTLREFFIRHHSLGLFDHHDWAKPCFRGIDVRFVAATQESNVNELFTAQLQ